MINYFLMRLNDYETLVSNIQKCCPKSFIEDNYAEYPPILITVTGDTLSAIAECFSYDNSKDPVYYRKVEAEIHHKLYQYQHNWITSRRQLVVTSDDCLSAIHIVPNPKNFTFNVLQRSSNIENALLEDIAFLAYMLKQCNYNRCSLNLFISMPHTFGNTKSKIQQE